MGRERRRASESAKVKEGEGKSLRGKLLRPMIKKAKRARQGEKESARREMK